MGRNLPSATNTAVAQDTGAQCDLVEMQFLGGTVRLTSAPVSIAAQVDSGGGVQTWTAWGGHLDVGIAEENVDLDAGGIDLQLSGVDNTQLIALLLTDRAIGRTCRIFTARFDLALGTLIDLPSLRFQGLMNEAFQIAERRPKQAPGVGSITIRTRVPGLLVELDRRAGIETNVQSHQAHYAGDKFFSFIPTLIGKRLFWGNTAAWLKENGWGQPGGPFAPNGPGLWK